jgi:single-strand DNA-binding protein
MVMSMSLNQVQAIGNVGRDPEVRFSTTGEPIVSFSVAASEKWTDKLGKPQERTEWFGVTVFGGLAKVAQNYVHKGDKVYIQGALRTEEWTDKDGVKKRSTKVILSGPRSTLILLGGKPKESAIADTPNGTPKGEWQADDSDVPF